MKPSSLATVLIRLGALYIMATGAFMFCVAGFVNFSMNRMISENGAPGTLNGTVLNFQFPASSVDTIFKIQVLVALAVVSGGFVLYKLSRAIGSLVAEGLEEGDPSHGSLSAQGKAADPAAVGKVNAVHFDLPRGRSRAGSSATVFHSIFPSGRPARS